MKKRDRDNARLNVTIDIADDAPGITTLSDQGACGRIVGGPWRRYPCGADRIVWRAWLTSLLVAWLLNVGEMGLFAQDRATAFGRIQLEQLLDDRPELREFVEADDKVGEWIVEQFAPSDVRRIYWDFRHPMDDSYYFVISEYGVFPGMIQVNADSSFVAERKFLRFVRSLAWLNCSPDGADARRMNMAIVKGKLSREEFIDKMLEFGFCAEMKVKQLITSNPVLKEKFTDPTELLGYETMPDTLDEYVAKHDARPEGESTLRRWFSARYDEIRSQSEADEK